MEWRRLCKNLHYSYAMIQKKAKILDVVWVYVVARLLK